MGRIQGIRVSMRLMTRLSVFVLLACSWGLSRCTSLPDVTDKPVARALPAPSSGPLASVSNRLARGRAKGHSSVMLAENNKEALDWRLALVDSARSSIDIQRYLWHDGAAGNLLFDRLLKAADRGVRVRLLVDDFLMNSSERNIAALYRYHPRLRSGF